MIYLGIEVRRFLAICSYTFITIFLLGCKKGNWYDVKSDKQLAVPTTLKDMQALLDNAWVLNTINPVQGEIASDGHYVDNTRANTLVGYDRNAYTWSREQPNINVLDWINSTSSGSYKRIYYTNVVLEGLGKIVPDGPSKKEEWNNLCGQALFHRSDAFYKLSQIFAPPYEESTANTKLGIPLRLESDINIPSKRSTVAQTYEQIINDLTLAKDLLPTSSTFRTRPSKAAALALLARIYLSMENYEKAFIYAGLCLDNYATLLNYNTLNATTTANPIMVYNPEIIFYSTMEGSVTLIFSNILIDPTLYSSYVSNDLRKNIFFNRNASTNLVTYKGTYSGVGFNQCFTGLATDEMYLIRAECFARQGKVTEAMKDLNILLKNRWISGTYVDKVAQNSEEALRIILDERNKELILRGIRWSDLRRLNRDSRFAITLTRTVGGKTYTLEPNSYKYTFPIPDDIVQKTGMEQNPGWE